MDLELVRACFVFGVKVAEHVHGIRRTGDDKKTDAIYETVTSVADGNLTLLNTPEEVIASLPTPPAGINVNIGPEFYEALRMSRENERKIAEIIVNVLPK